VERRLGKADVAKIYGVSERTVDNWVTEGTIDFIRLAKRRVAFTEEILRRWEQKNLNKTVRYRARKKAAA
jgi:predicted site-specific integrase-resolvase